MKFPVKLKEATLIRRYKRFLADIKLPDGSQTTIHCPNSGSMRSCSEPGSRVCYSTSDNPRRKYPHTLEMVHTGNTWVGVNTSLTNALVAEALRDGLIEEYDQFERLKREVKTSKESRLDIMLQTGSKTTYMEIKNCSLVENGCALFPDAVTSRGTKHLNELARLVNDGHEGVIFYLVQRNDAVSFEPAAHIDPLYAETLEKVHRAGVRILVYRADVSPEEIRITETLPFQLPDPGKTT